MKILSNNIHLLQLLLRLPELGEVEGGDLLRVLYLLLVGPRLVLELLYQLIQPLEVLLLLLPGELQLLDLPVSPQGSLVGLTRSVSSFIISIHVDPQFTSYLTWHVPSSDSSILTFSSNLAIIFRP